MWLCLELFLALGLVNHAVDGHIASEWNPADAVFRALILVFSIVLLRHRLLAEQTAEPVVVGAEKMEFIVEKEVELVHPCLEELGEKEVTSLVEDDQQSQRDDNLNNLY